jgi:phosphatidylserine decarboxylase
VPTSSKRGRACELQELIGTPLGSGETVMVGIAMSFLDVHVNRAPMAGRIALRKHVPGDFLSLRRPDAACTNERATTLIDGDGLQLAVVQIASRLVRQIVSFIREGDVVRAGQRIGVIRLGSQVDVVLPDRNDLVIAVEPGDRVQAGESVLAVVPKGDGAV